MVNVEYEPSFQKELQKIKDAGLREKAKKQIAKIMGSLERGKPMRYARKGTREVYMLPFRLSYSYNNEENLVIFLGIYHKDNQ